LPKHSYETAISGERRQVTALFYDIVGSTDLLQNLDAEDFARMQRRLHNQAAAVIRNYGGHLERIHGDGGSAYFGYPIASEDAAECAVAAALELVESCRQAAEAGDPRAAIQVRIGIATGTVVIADMSDTSLPARDEVVGITPALASRIQSEAEPNGVAVSEVTYRLTRSRFEYKSMPPRPLKGFGEMRLWRLLSRRPRTDRFSAERMHTPLIGRADELELCRRRWARAQEGRGQVIFLTGEPGIGKSRLVAELRQEFAGPDCEARLFQCLPRGNSRPLHPFIDTLRQELGDDPNAPVRALDPAAIRTSFAAAGCPISESAADMIGFLSGGSAGRSVGGTSEPDLTHNEVRRRAIGAALEIIAAWSRIRPQLIVIEDLHWADTFTEAVVAELAEDVANLPVLAIVTTRDEAPHGLLGEPNVLPIALSRLDAGATPRLLASIWQDPPPKGIASFIHDKSDGIPLFAEELATLMRERFSGSGSDLKDWEGALRESGIVTLQDLLAARLAGLGQARRIAQVASVIGREFSSDLLERMIADERLPLQLDEALETLMGAGTIRRRELGDGSAFRFRHVLLQEAAYDSLLKSNRREMHRRIADLVASGEAAAPPDEIMAWHCEQAGRPLDSARYAIGAASSCAIRSAMVEAESLLASAESRLAGLEPGGPAQELMLELLMTRGPVATALHGSGSEQARSIYERGVEICGTMTRPDPERWFPLYWGWWFTTPDYGVYRERAAAVVAFAEKAPDPEIRLQSIHCAWATDFNTGQHKDCLCRVERGLALYDPKRAGASRARYGGHDAKVCALAQRGLSSWFLGDAETARESVEAALAWAEKIDHRGSLCHALDFATMLRRYEGDAAGAIPFADRLGEIAERHALPSVTAKSRIFRGWARAHLGSLAEGLQELEAGLAQQREIDTPEDFPVYIEMQAELLGLAGQNTAGIALIGETIERAERIGHLFWVPELYRRGALLRHAAGEDEAAWREDLACAIRTAERNGAAMLVQRARADLARLTGEVEPTA
jgi:predicted ATPase/class 3 adenylate cyclase